jgi:long-chain acyl-CoA synthetase
MGQSAFQITRAVQRAALVARDRPAILDGAVRRTWGEFARRVQRLAGGLRRAGLAPGDRLAILSLNGAPYLELYYAVPWAGALVMPINIRLAPAEILAQIADAEPSLLFVDAAFARMLPELSGKMPSVRKVISTAEAPGTHPYEPLVEQGPPIEDENRSDDDVYGVFYTGGTTAASKGVMLTHTNIVVNAYHMALDIGFAEDDVYLHVAPMFHLADSANTFAVTMMGAAHAFVPAFDVTKTLEAFQSYRVTRTLLVPTMLNAVVNSPELARYDVSSLRSILYGGSPMAPAVMAKALDGLRCLLFQGYGMTETSPVLTFLTPEDHVKGLRGGDAKAEARLRSAGRPVPNVDVRILDPQGRALPPGEIGEICARGPNIMKGYWRKPEASAEALRGGFMHTGDLGFMDEDGYVFLVDRAKDMIVSGGENVYCVEVETALYSHPAVLEAAVFGVPCGELGERVHAVVVLKPGQRASGEDLVGHCRRTLGGYKCPKSVDLRDEPLPKSGAGKILKRDLRAPFWKGQERQIH